MKTARPARRGPMSTTGPSPACRRSPRGSFWRNRMSAGDVSAFAFVIRGLDPRIHLLKKMDGRVKPGHDENYSPRVQPLTLHADIDLALDIAPLLGGAQRADQFLERIRIGGRVFEPGQEVEGFAEIAAVIELPGDRRQVFQARRNVVRPVLKNLPPLLLRQLPP